MLSSIIDFLTSPDGRWWQGYAVVVGIVFGGLQIMAAVMVYAERKVAAFMQQRYGPYLVGPKGLLQPVADIVKLFFKEELRPKASDARSAPPSRRQPPPCCRRKASRRTAAMVESTPAVQDANAADLKFLHHLRQTQLRTSNRKAALES